jgi:Cu(I)/Ag(I) efflux system periplasmic protein CusF
MSGRIPRVNHAFPPSETTMGALGRTGFLLAIFTIIGTGAQAGAAPAIRLPASSLRHVVHEGHAGATEASGTVDAVDAAKRTITVSHGAIKSLGWPAMTMDFAVSEGIDLSAIKAGTNVNFTLVRRADGQWTVDTLKPQ